MSSQSEDYKALCQKFASGELSHCVGPNTQYIGDGIPLPPSLPKEDILELQKNLVVRSSDIFVTSYGRSGTNWICYIIQLIVNGGIAPKQDLTSFAIYAESFKLSQVEAMTSSPRCMKCHLPYDFVIGGLPHTTIGKYIYSYRNSRDVLVSLYHMFLSYDDEAARPVWSKLLDDFIKGNVSYGSQLDHIRKWWEHKDSPNILFLCYEDMKRDTIQAVTSISSFLGYEYSQQVLEEIAFKASFDEMKKTLQSHDSSLVKFQYIRKGIVGDWSNQFSQEDIAKMDAAVKEKLGNTDIVFDYGNN